MDLNNKLKNIPKIYYINLDERPDRKNYIESQFNGNRYWSTNQSLIQLPKI